MDGEAWWAAVHGVAKSRTRLHFHFSLSCIGEGNGNPLQCSCLENPRDRKAWWAAIYGVAQSRTRLKRVSSSSSNGSINSLLTTAQKPQPKKKKKKSAFSIVFKHSLEPIGLYWKCAEYNPQFPNRWRTRKILTSHCGKASKQRPVLTLSQDFLCPWKKMGRWT